MVYKLTRFQIPTFTVLSDTLSGSISIELRDFLLLSFQLVFAQEYLLVLTVVIPMCLSNSYKMYVSAKHNNLLHKIMLTATCFDSNESSSGRPTKLIQEIYIRMHFGIPNAYNE